MLSRASPFNFSVLSNWPKNSKKTYGRPLSNLSQGQIHEIYHQSINLSKIMIWCRSSVFDLSSGFSGSDRFSISSEFSRSPLFSRNSHTFRVSPYPRISFGSRFSRNPWFPNFFEVCKESPSVEIRL